MPTNKEIRDASIQAATYVIDEIKRELENYDDIPDDIWLEIEKNLLMLKTGKLTVLAEDIRDLWKDMPDEDGVGEIVFMWIVDREGDIWLVYIGDISGWSGVSHTDYPWRASVPVPAMSQYIDEEEGIGIRPLDKFGVANQVTMWKVGQVDPIEQDPYTEYIRKEIQSYKRNQRGYEQTPEGGWKINPEKVKQRVPNSELETQGFWGYIEFRAPEALREDKERVEKIRGELKADGYSIDSRDRIVVVPPGAVFGVGYYAASAKDWIDFAESSGVGTGSELRPKGPKEEGPTGIPISYESDIERPGEYTGESTEGEDWGEIATPKYYKTEETRAFDNWLHTFRGKQVGSSPDMIKAVIEALKELGYDIDVGTVSPGATGIGGGPTGLPAEPAPTVPTTEPTAEPARPGISEDERDEILSRLSELQKQKREMGLNVEEQAEYDKLSTMLRSSNKVLSGRLKELANKVIRKLRAYELDPDEVYMMMDKRGSQPAVLIVDKGRNEDVLYELYNRYVVAMKGIDYVLTACKSEIPEGNIIRKAIYRKGQVDPIGLLQAELANDPDRRDRIEVERNGDGYRLLLRNSDMYPTGAQVGQLWEELQSAYHIPNLPEPENLGGQGPATLGEGAEEDTPFGIRVSYPLDVVLQVYNTLPEDQQTNVLGYLATHSVAYATTDRKARSAVVGVEISCATQADSAYFHRLFPGRLGVGAQRIQVRSVQFVDWLGGLGFWDTTALELRHDAQQSETRQVRHSPVVDTVRSRVVEETADREPFEDGANGILSGVREVPVQARWDIKAGKTEASILKVGQRKQTEGVGEKLGEYDESEYYQGEIDSILEGRIADTDYILNKDDALNDIWEASGKDADTFYRQVKEAGKWDSFKDLVESYVYSDSDGLTFYWEMVEDNLTELMRERSADGDWVAKGEGMGWRSRSGTKEFHAEAGKDLVNEVLPTTDVTFYIYDYMDGRGLAINNFHHDAPMGEWYYLLPKNEVMKIKPLEEFGITIAREGDSGGEVLTDKNDKEDNKKDRKRDYTEKKIKPDNDGNHDHGAGWDSEKGNTDGKDDMGYNRLNIGRKVEEVLKVQGDYNGWANYETWNVNLWIDNEEGTYNEVKGHRDPSKKYTVEEVRQVVRRLFPTGTPDMEGHRRDLEKVDYQELADTWNKDLQYEKDYQETQKKNTIKPLEQFGQLNTKLEVGDTVEVQFKSKYREKSYRSIKRGDYGIVEEITIDPPLVDIKVGDKYITLLQEDVVKVNNRITPLEQFGNIRTGMRLGDLIEQYVNGRIRGNSSAHTIMGDVLYSYDTPIAVRVEGKIYMNPERYSASTSRAQNLLQQYGDTEVVDYEKFYRLVMDRKVPVGRLREPEGEEGVVPLEQFGGKTRFNRTYDTNYNYDKEVIPLNNEVIALNQE